MPLSKSLHYSRALVVAVVGEGALGYTSVHVEGQLWEHLKDRH